jgi:hypothetical protein
MIVQFEPVVAAQLSGEPLHRFARDFFDFAALAANRMVMMRRRADDIRRLAVLINA